MVSEEITTEVKEALGSLFHAGISLHLDGKNKSHSKLVVIPLHKLTLSGDRIYQVGSDNSGSRLSWSYLPSNYNLGGMDFIPSQVKGDEHTLVSLTDDIIFRLHQHHFDVQRFSPEVERVAVSILYHDYSKILAISRRK